MEILYLPDYFSCQNYDFFFLKNNVNKKDAQNYLIRSHFS
jgi:hypothetical protein